MNRHTKIEEIIDNNYVEEYSENQIKSEKIILKEEKPYEDPKMIKQRLNARFRRRKIILDRVCSILPSIAEMKKNGTTFEQLLQFHREIHAKELKLVEFFDNLFMKCFRRSKPVM